MGGKKAYLFKSLSIHKIPGFPRGMKEIEDFSENINLVVGPNASGKSSTARALQQLIWYNEGGSKDRLEAKVVLGEENWNIERDFGKRLVQKNRKDAEMAGIPASEGKSRYLLALDSMMYEEESDLAKEIVKQSIGGYDLDAARDRLRYSLHIYGKGIGEFTRYGDAVKKYREVRRRHEDLKRDEQRLTKLIEDREKAQEAYSTVDYYKLVIEFLKSKSDWSLRKEEKDSFDPSMEKLLGREYEEIQGYMTAISEYGNGIEQAVHKRKDAEKRLSELRIPTTGINNETLDEIEGRVSSLDFLKRTLEENGRKIAALKEKEQGVLKGFDDSVDPTGWKELSVDNVSDLDRLLQETHQNLSAKMALLARENVLAKSDDIHESSVKEDVDLQTLQSGIEYLSFWLKELAGAKRVDCGWIAVSSLSVVAAIAVALYPKGWGWFYLMPLSILIGIVVFYAYLKKGRMNRKLEGHQEYFSKLNIEPPSSWESDSVVTRLDELIRSYKEMVRMEQARDDLKRIGSDLKELEKKAETLESRHEQWRERLAGAPGFPQEKEDFTSLYWFIVKVGQWQEANSERLALEADSEVVKEQYEEQLNNLNRLLEKSGFGRVDDPIAAGATLKQLRDEEGKRRESVRDIDDSKREIERLQIQLNKSREGLSQIYRTLGVEEGDSGKVKQLVDQLNDFHEAKNNVRDAENRFKRYRESLEEYTNYSIEEIEKLSIDQAQALLAEYQGVAAGLDDINEEITRIETLVEKEKLGDSLQDAIAERERALDGLNSLMEKNTSSITGHLILKHLKEKTKEGNRPMLFHRANIIFNKITNGRYELLVDEDESGNPSFIAKDTKQNQEQKLTELSAGTRLQLLLSVRLAFVESTESSIKLPLFADELLGNSDDERAGAIIESLIKISKEGRQLFYFTAQSDEVQKWMIYLEKSGLDYKVISLEGDPGSRYDSGIPQSEFKGFQLRSAVPLPKGMTHQEYGEAIGVRPFHLLLQESGELPLWYVIEDPEMLYVALNRGVGCWAQLESYYQHGGQLKGFDGEAVEQMGKKVELLKELQKLYRRGRVRPIDRGVLKASGAVSGAFIDKVSEKMDELQRDPKKLVQALEDGEVPRFRWDNIAELEGYLEEEGYIDDHEVMDQQDIIIRLQAFVSRSGMDLDEAERFIASVLRT